MPLQRISNILYAISTHCISHMPP
uniref:Uncharacterized protein n=1 Tax=Arundo donax TaxID=35708 RepID=A0A0A9BRI3_ARUDO